MEKANFGQIVSFLFGIANDCLVDTYDVGDYRNEDWCHVITGE